MSVDRMLTPRETSILLHSQIVLPRRKVRAKDYSCCDNYESLWIRVNRICDRYIPNSEETLPAESD